MPSASQANYMGVAPSLSYKKSKPAKASKDINILLSDLAAGSSPVSQGMEAGSAMRKPKKTAPTPEERIEKAIEKAIETAIMQINRKLLAQGLVERVRSAINAKFHNIVSPADIDRVSKDAARGCSYELSDIQNIPASFFSHLPMPQAEQKPTYTEEPGAQIEDDDF